LKIDPKTPIAGLRPAVLKRVFTRGHFTTYNFANTTKLKAAAATAKLEELVDLGWVKPHPRYAAEWVATDVGDRLAATPLIPPISVRRARELLDKVIAAAEAVNADPTHSYVVERLALFGSLLDAPEDGWVGDVDLAFELQRRDLDPAEKERVWDAEVITAPSGGVTMYFWPAERVRRRLKVGRSVSLHPMDDLVAIGAIGHTVYDRGKITLPW
jgi:hypothetical protein